MNREPAVIIASIAAVIVFLAGQFNVVIELNTLESLLNALVVLLTGVAIRGKVTPV